MIVKNVETSCTHCGLSVPVGLIEPGRDEQFCCSGCSAAYTLIRANGLESFYRMLDSPDNRNALRRSVDNGNSFAELDETAFQEKFVTRPGVNLSQIKLAIEGIHCAACIWLIEKLPRILPGVIHARVDWAKGVVQIQWIDQQVKLSTIAGTLDRLGYKPEPVFESRSEQRRVRENQRHLIRIGIAAAAAGNNMLIAASLYLGMFSYMSPGMIQLLRITSCIVGMAALIWPGRVFLSGAWSAIRTRTPHMDLPIALALFVGTIAGLVNTLRGTGEIYFDSLSVLIFLLLVGRWLQFRQQNRAADIVELLYRLIPARTRRIEEGTAVETFVDVVQPDDLLEIRQHDLVPVDGVVVRGSSRVDESILTGESRPVFKSTEDEVLAGTVNCGSTLIVKATAIGAATRLSNIVELMEQAALEKPRIVQWANRVGGYFVGVVLVLAAITFFWWIWTDVSIAVERTVALLIVACPCALAIATPLAISVAIGRAARKKIIVKCGDTLQYLNRPGMIWLDKTGTLTTGQLDVVQWHGHQGCLQEIAALERSSSHPVATAIVRFAEQASGNSDHGGLNDSLQETLSALQFPGLGIAGEVNDRRITIGSEQLMRLQGIQIAPAWERIAEDILAGQLSPCWIAIDQEVTAIAAIGDSIRADADVAIRELVAQGWRVGILSGDHPEIVSQVANRLNLEDSDVHGAVTPEAKLSHVQQSSEKYDTVVMVGDGVNDSAALASASVGIAVHNSAEACLAAAPVYLAEEGLKPILELLAISRSTTGTMRKNLGISLAYNMVGATLAFAGFINPLVAAILMPASSLTVVAFSLAAGATSRTAPDRK